MAISGDEQISPHRAYLFAWNPKVWNWDTLEDEILAIAQWGSVPRRWTCVTRQINPEDRVFMIRIGKSPKGIMGAGFAYSKSHVSDDWEQQHVEMNLEVLINPDKNPVLPLEILKQKFPQQNWTPQASGIQIKPEIVIELESLWAQFLESQSIKIKNYGVEDYVKALRDIKLQPHQTRMLEAHYYAPKHIITASQMATAMGYKNHSAANLHYGHIGKMIGQQLKPAFLPEQTVFVCATFEKPGKEWLWVMRPQLAQALENLGLITEKPVHGIISTPNYAEQHILNPYKTCVYSIRDKNILDEYVDSIEPFNFEIQQRWITAKTEFEKARQLGQDYIALFCDSKQTDYICHAGIVESIEIFGESTKMVFKKVLKVKTQIAKTSLQKLSGENISENFIRPYCLCTTPSIEFYWSDVLHENEVVEQGLYEGEVIAVNSKRYERNPIAREKCLLHYGCSCSICGVNLADIYGEVAQGYIHVHHLKQLSDINAQYQVDPIADLRPVCPNCHAIIHMRNPPFSADEVKKFISPRNSPTKSTTES